MWAGFIPPPLPPAKLLCSTCKWSGPKDDAVVMTDFIYCPSCGLRLDDSMTADKVVEQEVKIKWREFL